MSYTVDIYEPLYKHDEIVKASDLDTTGNYCEIVIDKNGNIHRLHGSHDTALLYLASVEIEEKMSFIEKNTPQAYYASYREYLINLSSGIAVWYDLQWQKKIITPKQRETLRELMSLGKIKHNPKFVDESVI